LFVHFLGAQLLEKQISGMYIGEIVRYTLRKYIQAGVLFKKFGSALRYGC
jgi:hexokinase